MPENFVVRTDRVAWSRSGDQLVVLDLQSSTYLAFNDTAATLWSRMVDGSVSLDDLTNALRAEFDIDADTARQDAADFAEDVVSRGFVDAVAGQSP